MKIPGFIRKQDEGRRPDAGLYLGLWAGFVYFLALEVFDAPNHQRPLAELAAPRQLDSYLGELAVAEAVEEPALVSRSA
mgnify:CR=1 FL=1